MTPRLLTRTHYQVDEPAYLRVLILRCTSPIRSEYRERVADRLVDEVRQLGRMNVAAAHYAIDLARATGLINANNVWTERGHLLNLMSEANDAAKCIDLSLREQVFFFQLLLDADGAAIIYFLRQLNTRRQLPDESQSWNQIANDLFLWAFKAYHEFTSDLTSRTRLRQLIQKRQAAPFSGRSGEHQCFIHLQSIYRLGLIGKSGGGDSRTYIGTGSVGQMSSDYLLDQLDGVKSLERVVNEQKWVDFAARIYSANLTLTRYQDESDHHFYADIFAAYRRISATGVPLCPLRTLIDGVQIEEIVRGEHPEPFGVRLEALKRLQRNHPRQVHFHVDRHGRPAYLKLNPDLVNS